MRSERSSDKRVREGKFLAKAPRTFKGKARDSSPGSLIYEAEGGECYDTFLLDANRSGVYRHCIRGQTNDQTRPLA